MANPNPNPDLPEEEANDSRPFVLDRRSAFIDVRPPQGLASAKEFEYAVCGLEEFDHCVDHV